VDAVQTGQLHVEKRLEQADTTVQRRPALTLIPVKEPETTPFNRFQYFQERVRKYFTLAIKARNGLLQAYTNVFIGHKNDKTGSPKYFYLITQHTLGYIQKNLNEGKKIKIYDRVKAKII